MSVGMAGSSQHSKYPFNDFSIGSYVICYHRCRGRFLQQSTQQHQNAFLRNMFAKPATNSACGSFPGQERLLGRRVVNRHAKLALKER